MVFGGRFSTRCVVWGRKAAEAENGKQIQSKALPAGSSHTGDEAMAE